jgi:uncharacterized protein (TIGR00255 family)
MSLSSMTGFARTGGTLAALAWHWEVKSVNGKGLDIRVRVPPGFEALEARAREACQRHFKRGNLQVTLSCERAGGGQSFALNETALDQLLAIAERVKARVGGALPSVESLLGIRGVLDIVDETEDEAAAAARDNAIMESCDEAMRALSLTRKAEGSKIAAILDAQLARIAKLTAQARDNPQRSPDAIRARLAEQVGRLMETGASLDRDRLHMEAVLIATRADIQEEIDRLFAHVEAARALIASQEPAGRQLDFLAQEFNREANTLCSKAVDRTLTQTGLELKATIDQLREQVANVE